MTTQIITQVKNEESLNLVERAKRTCKPENLTIPSQCLPTKKWLHKEEVESPKNPQEQKKRKEPNSHIEFHRCRL